MAEQLAQLVREVERLVTAPYVPSLQDLHDLVQRSESPKIGSWAFCKPCQVGLLADVLVEALSRSRVALPLITAFASTPIFRDALLERHPVALDAFLEKAVNDNGEYSSACIALFSSPLPAGIVPPARIASLVANLVGRMAQNPCVKTVAPLHALISGLKGSPKVLEDIPTEVMSNLQLEFTKTLRNLDDHMGNLLCLAIFAQITTALDTKSHNQHGSESPSWLLSINHFFGQKRGLKTLDLVVLRVILACSSSCNLSPSEAAESIRLAICIADAIKPDQKQAWIAGNSSKIAKLCEKAARDGLHGETQTMVIVFLHTLLPAHSLSSQLRELGTRVLLSKDSQGTIEMIPQRLISRLAKSLAESGESTTRQLLTFTFDTLKASRWSGMATMATLHLSHLILDGLQESHPQTILTSANNTIATLREVLGEVVGHFPRQASESQCNDQVLCSSQLYTMQNKLFLSLLGLYNRVSSAQNGDDLIMRSFMERVEQSMLKMDCAFSTTTPKDFRGSFVLRDRPDPQSTQINRNWRSGVTDLFMQNAQTSHDSMMRKIEDTCFDLERRCDDVEGPLRAAEEERDRLAYENEQLKRCNEELNEQSKEQTKELETKLWNSSERVKELGVENTRLGQLLQGQHTQMEELTTSLDSAREEIQEQRRNSEQAISAEKERARSKELELMATLTDKEDQLEELEEEILHQASGEMATLTDHAKTLEKELDNISEHFKQTSLLADQQTNELNRLLALREDLRTELKSAKSTVTQQNTEVERLHSALQESEERSRSELERLKRDHEAEISHTTSKMAKQEAEKRGLQAAMQAAALDASKDAQSKDKRIQHLERKVQTLRDERAAKAREFSEAQQHIGRLMGVMGFSANAPESNASVKHQRTRSSMNPTTPATRIPEPISDEEDGSQFSQSFGSVTSHDNGPTPKRPRANPKPHVPSDSSAIAYKKKSPPLTGRITRSARKPLAEADHNSPTKSQSSSASKRSQVDDSFQGSQVRDNLEENRLQDLDLDMDLEFSRDFIFTNTDFTRSEDQTS
ncbi:hypothetical protein N7457_005631 [Penicillium paradoxum]|uniref:uncharacterized protein n=1 Tax=Penicillium paradoxum TaxID=176176 RepID=UPI002548157D|nr:uncharacterized protein N7457_005631 [Penicillium paradoxum]KAJ5780471.1 hypothetical protein N7457_005631 [Penicillium paradoxum]